MTITPYELATFICLPCLYLLFLGGPFHLAWQLRLYFWPVADRVELDQADRSFRLRLVESADNVRFERASLIERQLISLSCAVRSLLRVYPAQLKILALGGLVACAVAAGASLLFSDFHIIWLKQPYLKFGQAFAIWLISIFAAVPVIAAAEWFEFCKVEKRGKVATLLSLRLIACVLVGTTFISFLPIFLLLGINQTSFDQFTYFAFILATILSVPVALMVVMVVLAISYLTRGKMHDNQEFLFLSQSTIGADSIMAKSDYELRKLIDAANTWGEIEIAQWMGDELLRRSEKLELYSNYSEPEMHEVRT